MRVSSRQRANRGLGLLGVGVAALLFLVGCGGELEQTITFLRDGRWQAELVTAFPAQALLMVGGAGELEQIFVEGVADIQQAGGRASWRSERDGDNLRYTVTASSDDYRALQSGVLDGATVSREIVNGRPVVHFSFNAAGQLIPGGKTTITLVGGEILSTNGAMISKGAVQWINPTGRIEATLTEKSGVNLVPLLSVAALAGVALIGFGLLRGRRRRSAGMDGICHNCGFWLAPGADFCPNCGRRR